MHELAVVAGSEPARVNSCIKMDCPKVVDTVDIEVVFFIYNFFFYNFGYLLIICLHDLPCPSVRQCCCCCLPIHSINNAMYTGDIEALFVLVHGVLDCKKHTRCFVEPIQSLPHPPSVSQSGIHIYIYVYSKLSQHFFKSIFAKQNVSGGVPSSVAGSVYIYT